VEKDARRGGAERGRIQVDSLSKSFGSFRAVDNLSFEVPPAVSPASSARTAPARRPRCG
jgi:hypothetical protein